MVGDQALQLQALLQAVQARRPAAELAEALCRLLRACPAVTAVWYLQWQAGSGTYAHLGPVAQLPPGQGDPLQASDRRLFERLATQPRLRLGEVRSLDCWLAGRLRRAGVAHGLAEALSLQSEVPGLLLVALEEGHDDAWLGAWLLLLRQGLALAPGQAPGTPLLADDPQPSLLLDAAAQPLQLNAALQRLLDEDGCALAALLPVNHAPLVRACLAQGRASDPVEVQAGARSLVWTFIPDAGQQRVLARCREATEEIRSGREAAQARRLYRLITENTTDLISRHSPDGRYLDASPASWTLLGIWPEALRGQPVGGLIHPQDAPLLQQAQDALEQDGYHTMSFRIRHRDGHYLWFETASRAIRETYTGAVVEVVSVSRDITARVRAEENRRRLAEVVEANTDLVLFIEPDGQLSYLTPAARRALALADAAPMPRLEQLLGSDDLARLQHEGWTRAERAGVWSSEARLLPCDGSASLPVSLVLLAHSAAGGMHYHSLVARDMTERELREAQQRRHQDELAHTARLVTLGELASGIAHEINQPLAAVVNYAGASQRYLQALDSNPQAAERIAQGLERITAHANHAAEVIKRLRGFLRKGQRRMQALQPDAVAREAVRLCQWEAGNRQVRILEDFAPALPAVYADRVLLEQVLLNLLRNAMDANGEAHPGQPSAIELSALQQGEQLCIRVRDQGPGVAPEALQHIFTPFYTSKAEGLGLGLSMSRSIIEGFGGALEAFPAEGGGLCLECRLPVGRHESAEETDA